MQFFLAVGGGMMYPTAFAFINRASEGLDKGAVNGWANSSGALCRALFPPAAAALLTWGNQSDLPMGRYLALYINGFVGTACMAVALPGLRKVDRNRVARQPSAELSREAGCNADDIGNSRREPLVDQ
eukprot:TRINITY_DN7130_c0_g1_i1.p1 TRINITY_DN7130_c0_g1~~TRINITY_DN7130_c0_g1_i1.p1  ORF type:complete len:128 (-),score=15.90 TRINITY_DN7130_c0_g1_i1:264-647(-)